MKHTIILILLISFFLTTPLFSQNQSADSEITGNLNCSGAPILNVGPTNSTTVGLTNNVNQYSCWADTYNGPEKVYRIILNSTGKIVVDISNCDSGLDLFLLGSCEENDCLTWGQSGLSYDNAAPGTYYLVVDGWNGTSSAFRLNYQFPYADLLAQSASYDTDVTEGDNFSVQLTIKNYGNYTTESSHAKLFIRKTGIADYEVSPVKSVPSLSPDGTATVTWNFPFPDLGSGSYQVQIVSEADCYDEVYEGGGMEEYNVSLHTATINVEERQSPNLVIMPAMTQFDPTIVGNNSERFVNLKNEGGSNLIINNIEIIGQNANEFSIVNNINSTIILPNQSVDVYLKFTPQYVGSKSAYLKIECNDPASPYLHEIKGDCQEEENVTPHMITAMVELYKKALSKTLEDEYNYENVKHLGYFNKSLFNILGVSLYIDLDDYANITKEGQDGWVTLWFDFDLSIGIGFLPAAFGLTKITYDDYEPDPKRKFDFSGPSVNAGSFKIKWFEKTDRGFDWGIANIFEEVETNASFAISSFSFNLFRFEIKKEALNDAMTRLYYNSGNGKIWSISESNFLKFLRLFFSIRDNSFIPIYNPAISLSDLREYTYDDNGSERKIDGLIEFGRGGMDINDNGVWDNFYPVHPNSVISNFLVAWQFELRWRATGNSKADYFVSVENIPDGWNVWADDNPDVTPIFDNKYNSKDILPGSVVNTIWAINCSKNSVDTAKVLFVLHENKIFSNPPLDTLRVDLKKYKEEVVAVNAMCPIEISLISPNGTIINKNEVNSSTSIYNSFDLNGDGIRDKQIVVSNPEIGSYQIIVNSLTNANPTDTYSLYMANTDELNILAENEQIQNIPQQPYIYTFSPIAVQNETDNKKPQSFLLEQNYPNPFNPETEIRYELPKSEHVVLEVYNIAGQKVRTLVNEIQQVGSYQVRWNGRNDEHVSLPSGIYILRLKAGEFVKMRKMTLCK